MGSEQWTFNGTTLSQRGKWDVEEVLEGIGLPKYRGGDLQVPFQHGRRWIKKRFDRRKVVLSMWIKGSDRTDLDQNIDVFLRAIGDPGLHPLVRTLRNGEVRIAHGEVCSEIHFVRKGPGYAKFALEVELPDPFFYGPNKTAETETISTKTYSWNHLYVGSAPCAALKITFNGPLSSPRISNENSTIWLQYLGEIPSGQSVVIDTKYFKCTKGTENMISAIKHGGDAYWMAFESGSNSLKFETNTIGGSIKIEYYPAFY